MQVFTTYTGLDEAARGAAVAIGNFDGVHLGHQAILVAARDQADRMNAPLGVLTFEPHPRSFFRPDDAPFRLMNAAAKAHRLEKLGVDVLFQVPFDADFAALSAEAFCKDVLQDGLGATHVVVGQDFYFGNDRTGEASSLSDFGKTMGFGATVAPLVALDAHEVSSTRIRAALADARPEDAAAMLGHAHHIEGPVLHGEKRGRELGYPTANMSLEGLHLPAFGVYAVEIDILTGPDTGRHIGVASLGVRPMFGENTPNLETHIFDFSGDLYGQTLSVALVSYLRGEEKFDGLDALITQMDADSAEARRRLGR